MRRKKRMAIHIGVDSNNKICIGLNSRNRREKTLRKSMKRKMRQVGVGGIIL